MATELTIARGTNGQFLKGSKGLGGRKPGSRNKLGEKFISDLAADWQKNGKAALETVRNEHPEIYLRVIASIIPRDIWQRIEVRGKPTSRLRWKALCNPSTTPTHDRC